MIAHLNTNNSGIKPSIPAAFLHFNLRIAKTTSSIWISLSNISYLECEILLFKVWLSCTIQHLGVGLWSDCTNEQQQFYPKLMPFAWLYYFSRTNDYPVCKVDVVSAVQRGCNYISFVYTVFFTTILLARRSRNELEQGFFSNSFLQLWVLFWPNDNPYQTRVDKFSYKQLSTASMLGMSHNTSHH